MKKMPITMILSLLISSFLLTGCSFFQKEDISIDTGVMLEEGNSIEEISGETMMNTGELNREENDDRENTEEVVATEGELESSIKDLIDERKESLGEGDNLTEDDIKLMEDILDKLVNSVK